MFMHYAHDLTAIQTAHDRGIGPASQREHANARELEGARKDSVPAYHRPVFSLRS